MLLKTLDLWKLMEASLLMGFTARWMKRQGVAPKDFLALGLAAAHENSNLYMKQGPKSNLAVIPKETLKCFKI